MGLNSVNVILPSFHGVSDPKRYLKWEPQCDRPFQANEFIVVKTKTYVVDQYKEYDLIWWESSKRRQGVVHGGQYPPWDIMNALIRAKYILELRQED